MSGLRIYQYPADEDCQASTFEATPTEARVIASALIGADLFAIQRVVTAAVALVQATREGDGLEGERLNVAVEAYLAGLGKEDR